MGPDTYAALGKGLRNVTHSGTQDNSANNVMICAVFFVDPLWRVEHAKWVFREISRRVESSETEID